MFDYIEIIGLEVITVIGVYAWEQAITQKLLIDITIPTNCNSNDLLSETTDYAKAAELVCNYLTSLNFKLIETVAHETATLLLKEFNLPSIKISVSKPHALKQANNVRVTIERHNHPEGTCIK